MDHIDLKYAMMMSSRFQRWKIVSHRPYKINFRCPYCNDSAKSSTKARAWLQESNKTGGLRFFCFNCGHPASFYDFVKDQDPMLFRDYVAELYVSKVREETAGVMPEQFKEAKAFDGNPLKQIKKISQLAADHPARLYVNSRKIPTNKHFLIYYAPKFKTWINGIIPDKFDMKKFKRDEPRLILPFLDEKGQVFGVSARSFDPASSLRYISIMFDENAAKIFGRSTVDWNRDYHIVEGALDSMFLDNAIAMAGADGNTASLKNIQNAVFVYDNEPRNAEIHKRVEKAIAQGHRICVWPSYIEQKDINAMVLGGITNVQEIISRHTFKGLSASLQLQQWRKHESDVQNYRHRADRRYRVRGGPGTAQAQVLHQDRSR